MLGFISASSASISLINPYTELQLNTLLFRGNNELMKYVAVLITTQEMFCTGKQKCQGDYR